MFASKLGAIFAAVGSAVGLGNIWRFPYLAGQNGGGAFLFVYLLCVLAIGIPVMLAEFYIGRRSRRNPVSAMQSLAPGSIWAWAGYLGVFCAILINGFYYVVAGWTLEYLYLSVRGGFADKTPEELQQLFTAFSSNPYRPVFWMLVFILMTHFVIMYGVRSGIEWASKIMMPVLFAVLALLCLRAITLPGAGAGLAFLFYPDFSKFGPSLILSAMSQAFFSLSLGMGCMITYSSYFTKETNLQSSAFSISMLDTLVAVLAGIVIFPAVFCFGIAPTQGPELVFITLPTVFQQMPLGTFWAALFFILLILAALTSTISLHEVFTVYLHERLHISRRRATAYTSVLSAVLGVFSALSFGVLSGYTLFSMTFFDILDFTTTNVILPTGAFAFCLFVGWRAGRSNVLDEMTSGGTMPFYCFRLYMFLLKYILPVAIGLIFVWGILK